MPVENSPHNQVMAASSPIFGGGAALITTNGTPIVPSELQSVVEQAGAKYGLRLTVEWLDSAWGCSCFVVKQQWRQGDPKWARVQCGELPERDAFDVIHRFPPEMRTGDMVALLRDKFGFVRDPKAEAQKLIDQAAKIMKDAEETQVDRMVETGTQRILDESDHTRLVRAKLERAHPMVPGADFSGREPKRLLEVAPA